MTINLDPAAATDLARLFVELSQNPKTRKIIAKAVKDGAPDSPHARVFKDVEIEDQMEAFRAEQAEREIKRQQDDVMARMNRQRQQLLTGTEDGGRKYSEDDVKAIETLMQRKGISDYEDGATLYAATLPPVDPRPGDGPPPNAHGTTWEFPRWAEFGADPNKAARSEANLAITELMRKR